MLGILLFLNMLNPMKQMDTLHDKGILNIERLNLGGPGCRLSPDGPELCNCGACFVCDFNTCTCRAVSNCRPTDHS